MHLRVGRHQKSEVFQGRWALLGLLLFMPVLAEAASSAAIRVRVRLLGDVVPPNAISDLQAFTSSNEGEILLSWTAPADNPGNVPVSGYQIRYATFSVDDLGGNAAAWWAAATPFAIPPSFTVQPPLSLQGLAVTPLAGSATHYFAIRSFDAATPAPNLSALDDAALTPGAQAAARPRALAPAPVAGLLSIVNPDTSVNLNWNPVTQNTDRTEATDIADYTVLRATSFAGPFNVLVSSGAGANSFAVPLSSAPAATQYIKVLARDAAGNQSDPAVSNIVEITPAGIMHQMAVASDGVSRVRLPSSMMEELRGAEGDVLMRVTPNADPVVNRDPRALSSFDVSFISPVLDVDKKFALSRPAMNVTLSYPTPPAGAELGVLWWNGTAWVKVGAAAVDDIAQTVSFYTARPGTYQVRMFNPATQLALDKGSVFPRIFSPNGDGVNDQVFFALENPNGAPVEGKIYDVAGQEVADLRPAGAGAPTADSLAWNGRDKDGLLVQAGVYVYRIKGEGKSMTGTVVVAK